MLTVFFEQRGTTGSWVVNRGLMTVSGPHRTKKTAVSKAKREANTGEAIEIRKKGGALDRTITA